MTAACGARAGRRGHARDQEKALQWTVRASEQGHAAAMTRVARALLTGKEGLERDVALGIEGLREVRIYQ